ncbi:protealysin inhibitor emfourin [Methanosarcina sp.]|uniref:protealysin inhibitor emfourin n=1 Tax=Methanosarcina sp. TaxID=2213 RepID=UPI003C73F43E
MVIMHVDFESSGGYANIKLTYYGNTDILPEEVANKLIQLVESSRIFDLKENEVAPKLSGPPDVLYYKLTIYEDNKRISLSFNDITAPDSLRPLLTFLQELAWEQIRKGKSSP